MKFSEILKDIGKPVAYFPRLAVMLGGVKEVIFLAQIIYWADKGLDEDGWVFKTSAELLEETGLSRWEQEGARKSLRGAGILEERYARLEHRLYYHINFEALDTAWATFANVEKPHSGSGKNHIREVAKTTFALGTENTTENTTDTKRIYPPLPTLLPTLLPTPGGATPHTPVEAEKSAKFVEEIDKCMACTSAEEVVTVWQKRLSLVPGMRGPGVAKRRQWIGELERWVKEDGGLTYQDVLEVLIFAMESDFWRTVITSPKILKRNWDTLVGQRLSRNGGEEVGGVLAEFAQEYARARGKEYIVEGKDKFKARELLGQVAREEVGGLIKAFFGKDDDFLDKQGRTFSCFVGQVNRLRKRKEVEAVNKRLQENLEIIRRADREAKLSHGQ